MKGRYEEIEKRCEEEREVKGVVGGVSEVIEGEKAGGNFEGERN